VICFIPCRARRGRNPVGLRICAAVTFARLRVMPSLPIFLAEHPVLDDDVVLQDGDIDLIEPVIDVALRMSPLRDSALTGRKIGRRPMRVVGTPAYFAATGLPQAPTDLPAHQAIIYERRLGGATRTCR
jgi:DNA-binding transcriptional LysR family regulator